MKKERVVVIGGSFAGVASAVHLARAGVDVTLLEGRGSGIGAPALTLPPRASRELARLDIDAATLSRIGMHCPGIQAQWGKHAPSFQSYLVEAPGVGWHVEPDGLRDELLRVASAAGAEVVRGASFLGVAQTVTGSFVMTTIGEAEADFVVDASGRAGVVARSHGVVRQRSDRMCAASAHVHVSGPTKLLRVESVANGWWYFTPTAKNVVCATFVTDADLLSTLGAKGSSGFARLFRQTQFAHGAEDAEPGEVNVAPCDTAILDRLGGPRWLAIGDAAMTFDPLSSMGVTAALWSAREGAAAVVSALRADDAGLVRYEMRWRKRFNHYLHARSAQYQLERRWPSELFWERRAPASDAVVSIGAC